jgi:hypothetical protein
MPIPWSSTEYYDNENIMLYDNELRKISWENNMPYLYMFDLLKDSEMKDGLHPDAIWHEKMFQKIKKFLSENNII